MDYDRCKNCGKRIKKAFVADTEFYGHEEWRHIETESIFCEIPKIAEPLNR